MSSSTPSKPPASARTVLELGTRQALEVSRTVPAATNLAPPCHSSERSGLLALGTNPPTSNAVAPVMDAHLIAIGTPAPGAVTPTPDAVTQKAFAAVSSQEPEPKTMFLGARAFVPPSRAVTNAPRASLAIAMLLGILALAIAPLGPLAWMHAAEQLDLVARGMRRATGQRCLHAVQGIGIAMTMIAVAATAFGITVVIARYMR